MFGAEGDRRNAMRAQQQQQYAEELRRQIEEKQNKNLRQKRTPPAYSTTTNDSMQSTINNMNYNDNNPTAYNNNNSVNNNYNSPNSSSFNVRPPSMVRHNLAPRGSNYLNSPSRNSENNFNDSSNSLNSTYNANYSSSNEEFNENGYGENRASRISNHGSREDYYSIPTVSSVAPLTLNVQPPSSLMTTTYMMGPSSTLTRGALNTDRSTFPSRVDSLESRLFNLRDELKARTEKVNDFVDSIFPSTNREIADLRSRIESESNQDIPQQLQPLRNALKDQRNSIENINQNQREIHSGISSEFSEINAKINAFMPKFTDLQDFSKSSFVTLRGDINRHRNALESSSGKIGKIESQDLSIINKLSAQNEEFNEIDKGLSQNFENFQANTNELMLSLSSQFAYDIQNESQKRDAVSTKLQSQVSEVNDRAKSAISRLSQNVNRLNFKDSLEEISKQLTSAISTTNNDAAIKVTDLTRRLDSFLAECEENFGFIQNETVSTIESIKNNHMGSMEILSNSLEDETRVTSKNMNEVLSKYAQFRELIQQEEKLQMENCNRNFNDLIYQMKSSIGDQTTPMYKDVHGAIYLISHIEETEAKLDNIEKMIKDVNNNLRGKMSTFQLQFKNHIIEINNVRNSMMAKFDELDNQIEVIQSSQNKPANLKRTEIYAIQKVIETGLDAKMNSIEQEIDQILKQIGALQISDQKSDTQPSRRVGSSRSRRSRRSKTSNPDGRTEGAILLESLVNDRNDRRASTCVNGNLNNEQSDETETNTQSEVNKTTEPTTDTETFSNTADENDNSNTLKNESNENENENENENDNSNTLNNESNENENENENENDNSNTLNNEGNEDKNNNLKTENTLSTQNENENESNNDIDNKLNVGDVKNNVENDVKDGDGRIGANPMLETCQRFHFVPPEDIFDNHESHPSSPSKKASTVTFSLDDNDNDNIPLNNVRTQSLSMPKLTIGNELINSSELDTSFSASSIKQNLPKNNKKSLSLSNSSSSANQRDESPISAADVKLPFARTNEIEQILKPEALATLPPRSSSQIIQSANRIISDDAVEIEEEEEEGEIVGQMEGNSDLKELDQIPPELTAEGNNIEAFKFNPDEFKIDLDFGAKKKNDEEKKKGELDQKIGDMRKIIQDDKKEKNEEEEEDGEEEDEEEDSEDNEDENENEDEEK